MRSTGSRLPALLAAGALLLGALTACSSSHSSAQHKYGLINDGVITAATIPDNAPFASPGPDGRPQGLIIDLTDIIAKRLGVKVVYKQTTVPAALAGLTSGQYDYAAVSLSQTPERARNVLFSTPLTWGQNITMVRKESSAHTLADFAGKRVGVATGSSQADYAAANLKQSKIVDFNNDSTALSQLINGSIDGYVMGLSQAAVTMQQHPGLLRIATSALQPNPAGVAFRKGNKAFYDAYEKVLASLVSDGTFLKLYNRYFTTIPYRPEMVRYWPQLKAQLATQS